MAVQPFGRQFRCHCYCPHDIAQVRDRPVGFGEIGRFHGSTHAGRSISTRLCYTSVGSRTAH
jgi:hypothetical protein